MINYEPLRKKLEILINEMYNYEIPILFGENSKIVIDDFNFSNYQKVYYISLKLVDCDPEIATDVFTDALDVFFSDVWKFIFTDKKYVLTMSIKY